MVLRNRKKSDASSSVRSETMSVASKGSKGTASDSSHEMDETSEVNQNEVVEEVMRDNLDLMLEIVMRIREDPHFASTIYSDCPRLQHLLDQNPDLRPIFEDPYLVRLNFEKVYTDAGGTLPDAGPANKSLLAMIVSHPLFKVFRFLLVIKKVVSCIMGGGAAFFKSLVKGMCFDDVADMADLGDSDAQDQNAGGNNDNDDDRHDTSPENQEAKENLNRAADHMEDPEVQERMNEILNTDDPEQLDEAIENDPELKALRDSNPLCEELMSDPETMRILVDPDNLRALGECPDLIEQDFANPDWSPPDVEAGPGLDTIGEAEFEGALTFEAEPELDEDLEDIEAGEDDAGSAESNLEGDEDEGDGDEEEEDEEEEGPEFEMGDEEVEKKDKPQGKKGSKSKKGKNQMKKRGEEQRGNFFHNLGVGLTDMVAGEIVGETTGMLGIDDGLTGLEDAAGDEVDQMADQADVMAEEAAEQAAGHAEAIAESAEVLMSDDFAANLEEGMDQIEDTHDERLVDQQKGRSAAVGGAAGVSAVGAGAAVAGGKSRDVEAGGDDDEDEDDEVEEEEKQGRFGFVGNLFGAVSSAAKEFVATELLGDDLGEELLERMEGKFPVDS